MTAVLQADLSLDTYCDFLESFTFVTPAGAPTGVPVNFTGATATMMIRANSADAAPLLSLSTTATASGQLFLGIAPAGPLGATVANLAALAALATGGLLSGAMVQVVSPASYYVWSPASILVPDGVSIVAGIGGDWLLTGTIEIKIPAAAMAALVGTPVAFYDVLVTFPSAGGTFKYLEGSVFCDQTSTH
jgi:hypothetical protein